jgi:prepilin-type N-terminal cleavage/methylation domain-containing protein
MGGDVSSQNQQEMNESSNPRRRNEKGFSLLEMIIASAILLVGVLSVVQLVPTSLRSNLYNRMDTMATVVAQHQLDLMLNQPLNATAFTGINGIQNGDSIGGSAGWSGSPVVMQGSSVVIDFSQNPVNGYSVEGYQDPQDPNFPNGTQFELRWAVYTVTSRGTVISKRILVGCRQTNAAQPMLPVDLDTSVQR